MTSNQIIRKIATNNNLDEAVVSRIYNGYYSFIRNIIKDIPFKDIDSEELFNNYRCSFNLPYIGKLGCTYKKLKGIKKRYGKDIKD